MESLSTLLLLALLALGQATPLTTVTQSPRTDQDVIREAVTDGFIVDQELLTSLPTQDPRNMTKTLESTIIAEMVHRSPPKHDSGEEGSGMVESLDERPEEGELMTSQPATTQPTLEPSSSTSALPVPSSTPMAASDALLLNKQSDMPFEGTTPTEPSEDKLVKTTTADLLNTMSDEGSGDEDISPADPAPLQPNRSSKMMNVSPLDSDAPMVDSNQQGKTETHKGHVTPDWIIILGFLVGVAALVLICAAIATRDRWNRPDQFNTTGVTLTPADQQSELEMEEFLHKKHPRENGKADEYTVIPLDELPDSYSS